MLVTETEAAERVCLQLLFAASPGTAPVHRIEMHGVALEPDGREPRRANRSPHGGSGEVSSTDSKRLSCGSATAVSPDTSVNPFTGERDECQAGALWLAVGVMLGVAVFILAGIVGEIVVALHFIWKYW